MVDYLQPPTAGALASKGRVTTLGMFIIDHFEIKDASGKAVITEDEQIGGGGIWAMTAARQFLPPSHVGMLVDRGFDFPEKFTSVLEEMGSEMVWFRKREGKTSRALNIYSGKAIGEGHQSFKYLSPQLNLLPHDLLLPPSPFTKPHLPEWIHVVCNTTRARLMADEVKSIRQDGLDLGDGESLGRGWEAKMVWEPLPMSTVPSELENFRRLAPHFAVISPNLLELQTLLSIPSHDPPTKEQVESATQKFHHYLSSPAPTTISPSTTEVPATKDRINNRVDEDSPSSKTTQVPALVVRAGALGAYSLSEEFTGWIPAYWRSDEVNQVVDPTGGGNAFLGGLLAGLLISDGDLRIASLYASTAASFAIQQRGLPLLSNRAQGHDTGVERWNGDSPWERLRELARRIEG